MNYLAVLVRHNKLMYVKYVNTYKYTLRAKRLKFTFNDNFNGSKTILSLSIFLLHAGMVNTKSWNSNMNKL